MWEKNQVYFVISIDQHKVYYWDKCVGDSKLFGSPIQWLPPCDPSVFLKIDLSRNRIPPQVKDMLRVTKEELADFEAAKTDDELKEFVIKDCKFNGCRLVDMKIE